jgi:ATP adenylyltransferase
MDHLWSPWRFAYVSRAEAPEGCVFCGKADDLRDRENLVVYRGDRNYILLNLYPYTTGHLMIAPYAHVATLGEADEETALEMMRLTRAAERHLRAVYHPQGVNIGMNIGACAGAGVAGHIHMHALPRWLGDVNFMTTIGETRVVVEDLETTWEKLRRAFQDGR